MAIGMPDLIGISLMIDEYSSTYMSDTKNRILTQLASGNIIPGSRLAEICGISRAAVWKHIESLRGSGVMIDAIHGRGYWIRRGMNLLNQQTIRQYLSSPVGLTLHQQVSSTNSWLMRQLGAEVTGPHVCIAERQTAGRGTKGRTWQSPYGTNLYCSLYWRFDYAPCELGGLSLAVAISLVNALGQLKVRDVKIKWPNDLHTPKGKLGGILIDMSAETEGPSDVVIGIGLNIGMPEKLRSAIDQPVADIHDDKDAEKDRNIIAVATINALISGCENFADHGFSGFVQQWEPLDMSLNQQVRLTTPTRLIEGIACGVNERGMLRIKTSHKIEEFASGDVSMRINNETTN